eukprot:111237_1
MRDRMKQELTSKDLYRFGQIPMAKHHLVIDHSLCKALYLNQIVSQKYFNAQFMEISYVFWDGSYETFEDKYYSFLSKVISKSPLLHTIKFNLKLDKFKTKLFNKSNDRYSGYTGHLLEWMDSVIKHSSNDRVFESITRCIWGPSQFRFDSEMYKPSKWRVKYDLFCKYFPNLKQFTLQNSRKYRMIDDSQWRRVLAYDDTDCVWSIFKAPFYHNTLEHIDCNMNRHKQMLFYWSRGRHIRIPNHPLSHLHKFKNLKSLHLKLPILNIRNSHTCYKSFIPSCNDSVSRSKCMRLTSISIEFASVIESDCNAVEDVGRYILSLAPNVTHYKLIANHITISRDHLIGFYDRLESLHTDSYAILSNGTRMLSLKQLTVHLSYGDEDLKSKYKDLNAFPNLERFKCIYDNPTQHKWNTMNRNIDQFLEYVSQQTNNKKLKYISICHNTQRKASHDRWRYFNAKQGTKSKSMALCKSIVNLTTNSLFGLKSIEMVPVALRQKELEYLYFWFVGIGHFDSTNSCIMTKSGTVLTDIYCSQ